MEVRLDYGTRLWEEWPLKVGRLVASSAAAVLLYSIALDACRAAVVTVDVPAQTVRCDDERLQTRWMKQRTEQVGAFIQNTTLEPHELLVKIIGLKEQRYDVYINTKYVGVKTAKELESGLSLTVSGSVVDPDMMLCLKKVQPMVDSEYLRLRTINSPEPARVCATLQQAIGWIRSAINAEKFHRSASVVVNPEGRMLEPPQAATRLEAEETASTVTRSCWLLQQARARMASVINEPDLRDSAVASMTPVDFATSYVVKNGRPHVEAVVTNYCNLPISGKIMAAVPKGWKWNAKNTTFAELKTGKAFKLAFDLLPVKPGAAVPEGLKMTSLIRVVQEPFSAEYRIRTLARTPNLESALRVPPGYTPPPTPPSSGTAGPPEKNKS
jgi:hypothetical protein